MKLTYKSQGRECLLPSKLLNGETIKPVHFALIAQAELGSVLNTAIVLVEAIQAERHNNTDLEELLS